MKTYIGLIAIILLGGFLFWVKPADKAAGEDLSLSKRPQEYMIKAFVTFYTEEGNLKNQLSADYWAYFPKIQASLLTTPHLTVYKADGTLWKVDAKKGKLQQPTLGSIEKISLQEKVILERPGTATAMPIKLETEMLDYHPKQQFAEGDQSITLIKPGLKITGIGLRAFLDKGIVELLKNVQTQYVIQ
jgi:LPS export ABC transporter protein LptC